MRLSTPGEALIFFMIRLIERLRECVSAPAVDLMEYGRGLESFGERQRSAPSDEGFVTTTVRASSGLRRTVKK